MQHLLHHKTLHIRQNRIIWASNLGEMDEPLSSKGAILHEADWVSNLLYEEGEHWILGIAFRDDSQPANLYLGLCNDASPADGDTLSTIAGEQSGTGYSRAAIPTTTVGWSAPASGSTTGTTTPDPSFTATGGDWIASNDVFLTTASSGTSGSLIAIADLSTTRTLANGDSLDCTIAIALE